MRLSKGQQTKIRIIEVATDLFMKEGLYNVTFAEVAKGIGLSQPSIYRHFEDMDDLVLQACLHWTEHTYEGVSFEAKKASVQLKEYVEGNFKYSSKNRSHDGLLLGLYYYSMRSKKMLEAYQSIKTAGIQRIKMILQQGNLDHSWKAKDIDNLAYTFHSIMVGEIIKLIIEPKEVSIANRCDRVLKHFGQLL